MLGGQLTALQLLPNTAAQRVEIMSHEAEHLYGANSRIPVIFDDRNLQTLDYGIVLSSL